MKVYFRHADDNQLDSIDAEGRKEHLRAIEQSEQLLQEHEIKYRGPLLALIQGSTTE